jgi:hypothetical protein
VQHFCKKWGLVPDMKAKKSRDRALRRKLGYYGTVPLWLRRNAQGTFLLFNDLQIAKRVFEERGWEAVAAGWKVTPIGSQQIRVQHNDSEGVIVSLAGDVGK